MTLLQCIFLPQTMLLDNKCHIIKNEYSSNWQSIRLYRALFFEFNTITHTLKASIMLPWLIFNGIYENACRRKKFQSLLMLTVLNAIVIWAFTGNLISEFLILYHLNLSLINTIDIFAYSQFPYSLWSTVIHCKWQSQLISK